jgi:hypothetical protein
LAKHFTGKVCKTKSPKGVLYIRNVDGEENAKGEVISYFPVARGIKTERYTLAITIDSKKQVKEMLLFDDKNDPYQMNTLNINDHQHLLKKLTKQMGALLKNANDPWYREKMLPELIRY